MEGLLRSALFAGRFQIEEAAGSGGMGTVYRARDLSSQQLVALKLLQSTGCSAQDAERFLREAQLLAELQHPGIVSHVAHGQTADGQRYLAMEWLDGEDLSQRLKRGVLTLPEALSVLRQITDALGAAHARGVVHRDIKPSNLFLVAGDLGQLKLLDFGIARRIAGSQVMTRTGLVVGTPEYMAPEQARGERELMPSTDLFSLACVAYECLAGQPPFAGEHLAAVLTRILFEPPPDLRRQRPDAPEELWALLDRMLAKDPAHRPRDAAQVAQALAQLGSVTTDCAPVTPATANAATLTASFAQDEQELLSVVLAEAPGSAGVEPPGDDEPAHSAALTFREGLARSLRELGARVEWLLGGAIIATLSGQQSATDLVARAARAALLIRDRWPAARIALSTGRALLQGNLAVGEAVDQGARLLDRIGKGTAASADGPDGGVWLDELSAGLLVRRFAMTSRHGIWLMSGVELAAEDDQPLLGKPTPCIGRENELAQLDLALTSCIEESTATVMLITASAGVGKSRLGREFLRRVAARAEPITILSGRSELISSGSPYAILRDTMRRWCELGRGASAELAEAQRKRLTDRLAAHLPGATSARVVAFLGELCGVPFPDDDLPILRAARNDPKIMSDQLAEALLEFFRAECSHAPLILFLEDFQWVDVLTVKFTTLALRELAELPLLIVALARPEVHEVFPKLWSGLRLRETMLMGLSKKASERLIHQALGRSTPAETVARIIEQAAGNTLFLEELIRVVAAGDNRLLPATVLAMLQARIGQLDNTARRVLRAGSIFGQTFWIGGLQAVLHHDATTQSLDGAIQRLIDAELIQRHPDSRIAGAVECGFRHSLVRDAAYSLLTEEDLRLGHRRAGEFLAKAGETDALILAGHFERAGESGLAAQHYLRAGLQSFDCNELDGALARAERGIACGASGQILGELRTLCAMAHCWRSELAPAFVHSLAALPLVRPGSRAECSVLFHGLWSALVPGHEAEFLAFVSRLTDFQPEVGVHRDLILWASLGASLLTSYGRRRLAHALLTRAGSAAASVVEVDLALQGAMLMGRSDYVRAFEADPWTPLALSRAATAAFEEIGDRRDQVTAMSRLGQAQGELGDFASAEQTLRAAATLARRIRVPFLVLQIELHLAALLCCVALPEPQSEAKQIAEGILGSAGLSAGYRGWCMGILAQMDLLQNETEAAVAKARAALELCSRVPLRRLWVQTLLTRGLIAGGNRTEVRRCAEDLLSAVAELGGAGYAEVSARLAAADAFRYVGDDALAIIERQQAHHQLELRIACIPEPAWRNHYVTVISDNARLLADEISGP